MTSDHSMPLAMDEFTDETGDRILWDAQGWTESSHSFSCNRALLFTVKATFKVRRERLKAQHARSF